MEINSTTLQQQLRLPKVGQLGFIVHDIEDSLPMYESLFNLKTWFEPLYAEKKFIIGGEPRDLDFKTAFGYSGNVQVEIFEEKSQQAPVYTDYLDKYGSGLHHLGFYVNDLDANLRAAEQIGLDTLLEAEFKTAGGGFVRYVYLDSRQQTGIITELIHITLFGISVPQTEFMMNIGVITGDVKKIKF